MRQGFAAAEQMIPHESEWIVFPRQPATAAPSSSRPRRRHCDILSLARPPALIGRLQSRQSLSSSTLSLSFSRSFRRPISEDDTDEGTADENEMK